MEIRAYRESDLDQILRLFVDTVHTINIGDYTPRQVEVWAASAADRAAWASSLARHTTFVAVEGDVITGFGDIDSDGYLDRLYVHSLHQRRGIATALCDKLERVTGEAVITVHASITAKRFFERRGYAVIRKQEVTRKGITLTNYVMELARRGR